MLVQVLLFAKHCDREYVVLISADRLMEGGRLLHTFQPPRTFATKLCVLCWSRNDINRAEEPTMDWSPCPHVLCRNTGG